MGILRTVSRSFPATNISPFVPINRELYVANHRTHARSAEKLADRGRVKTKRYDDQNADAVKRDWTTRAIGYRRGDATARLTDGTSLIFIKLRTRAR